MGPKGSCGEEQQEEDGYEEEEEEEVAWGKGLGRGSGKEEGEGRRLGEDAWWEFSCLCLAISEPLSVAGGEVWPAHRTGGEGHFLRGSLEAL